MTVSGREWIKFCCQQLVSGLTANDTIKSYLTSNPDLIGAYAESSVREFVRSLVAPLRVSCGSIVYEGNCGEMLPQLDTIIWHPCPFPPILEAGEFAMVPRGAGLAFLEIKRSNYSGTGNKIKRVLDRESELVPPVLDEDERRDPDLPSRRSLGVICLYKDGSSDRVLQELIEEHRVAVVLRQDGEGSYVADTDGVLLFARFLMNVRRRAKYLDGEFYARLPGAPR